MIVINSNILTLKGVDLNSEFFIKDENDLIKYTGKYFKLQLIHILCHNL